MLPEGGPASICYRFPVLQTAGRKVDFSCKEFAKPETENGQQQSDAIFLRLRGKTKCARP